MLNNFIHTQLIDAIIIELPTTTDNSLFSLFSARHFPCKRNNMHWVTIQWYNINHSYIAVCYNFIPSALFQNSLICGIIICILLVNFINKYYEFSCQIQFVFRSSNLMDRVVLLGLFNYIKIHTLIKLYMMMEIVCK